MKGCRLPFLPISRLADIIRVAVFLESVYYFKQLSWRVFRRVYLAFFLIFGKLIRSFVGLLF